MQTIFMRNIKTHKQHEILGKNPILAPTIGDLNLSVNLIQQYFSTE